MIETKEKLLPVETDEKPITSLILDEPTKQEQIAAEIEGPLRPVFDDEQAEQFRALWLETQGRFIDNPFTSVRDADELINGAIGEITEVLVNRKILLEKQWRSGYKVSTEELRVVMKQYRVLLDRLLSLKS